MCGICGIYHYSNKKIDPSNILDMTKSIKHRGPDDEGYLLINTHSNKIRHAHHVDTVKEVKARTEPLFADFQANLAFGYRRLSILDLSAKGHQPMSNRDGSLWIIFNGEVYNYIEIREDLKKKGYQFKSGTDTEVIIYAYQEWGNECLSRFNGMFAFSLWDRDKGKLFCARDRLGIKPFYYYHSSNIFIWASEIKQLIASNLVPIGANLENIYNFLLFSNHNFNQSTFFDHIHELPPGHYALISDKAIQIEKYWSLSESSNFNINSDKFPDQFLDLFKQSVKLRMRSDVPIGIALSGGLDSSSIACVASQLTQDPINTFSVYYEDAPEYDERIYISEVLKRGNFNPVYYTSGGDYDLSAISRWIYYQDEPCISASPFSAYNNYRNIRNAGITVALNGQGGDETLAGYRFYFKFYFLSLIKRFQFYQFTKELFRFHNNISKNSINTIHFLMQILARLFMSSDIIRGKEKSSNANLELYDNGFLNMASHVIFEKPFKSDLDNKLYETLSYTILPRLLHWEDRNSMAFSVESRVPFLDHNLVEFLMHIPMDQKIDGHNSKVVLRNAMRGILPEKIRKRTDKIGFGTPTDIWTSQMLKGSIKDLVYSQKFKERGIYQVEKIKTLLETDSGGFKKNELWKIMTLELWFQQFIDKS